MQITFVRTTGLGDNTSVQVNLGCRDTSPEWLEAQLSMPTSAQSKYVAIQRAALEKLRSAIDNEIRRLDAL